MADNLVVTPGTGVTLGMDEVTDGTLGIVHVGYGKIMDGTLDSTNKLIVNSSGEALVHPTANSSVNVNQVGGTAVDTNSGNKSAGTQRVVLATDQPQLTNALKTSESSATTVLMGKVTVTTAGTRVQLSGTSKPSKAVVIRALETNTGLVYVGDSTVASTNGHRLSPGESVGLEIADLTNVYLDSAVNGEGISYLGSV